MNRFLLFAFFLILSFNAFSQIKFEKGYYITNDNDSIPVLIRNKNFKNNPTEFIYKSSQNSPAKIGILKEIKEFGVHNGFKYQREKINPGLNETSAANPIDENSKSNLQEVFLRVLVEGAASLYSYKSDKVEQFFYSYQNSSLKPLIFNTIRNPEGKIRKNRKYQLQLYNTLNCKQFPIATIEKIRYRMDDLTEYFQAFNICAGASYQVYKNKPLEGNFNLSVKIGAMVPEFQERIKFGMEAEYVLPVFYNKISFFLEPVFTINDTEREITADNLTPPPSNPTGPFTFKKEVPMKFTTLEIPLGLRYSLFFDEDSKLFVEVAAAYDLFLDSEVFSPRDDVSNLKIESGLNTIIGGIGYKFKSYSAGLRLYNTKLNFNDEKWTGARYNYISVNLGYTIF